MDRESVDKIHALPDRKALITNLVNVLGYCVVCTVLAVAVTIWLDPEAYRYPPLLQKGTWAWY